MEQFLPVAADSSTWLADYGWAILLFLILLVISLYLWSYLSKNLEQLKVKESDYTDDDVITYISRMVKVVLVIILVFVALFVTAQVWQEFRTEVWDKYLGYLLDIVFISIVLLVAMLIVRVLRRVSRRARMTKKDVHARHGSAIEFTSLLLSYVVYVTAAGLILLVLISFVPNLEPLKGLRDFLDSNGTKIGSTIILVIAIFAVVKLVGAIFEDYKFRTKKFNPQVIDLFNDLVRYVLYIIAFLTAIFMLFSIAGLESVGFLLVIVTLLFVSLGIAMSYTTIRNIVSGLALMNSDPFDVGDRVKLGKDLVCEVVEKNLVFTRVRTEDGETVEVPNSQIISGTILNFSRSGSHGLSVRLELPSSISHSIVEDIIAKAVTREEGLMKEPKPEVFAREFRGDKISYEVIVYVKDSMRTKRVRSDLIINIQDAFEAAGLRGLGGEK